MVRPGKYTDYFEKSESLDFKMEDRRKAALKAQATARLKTMER